MKDRILKIFILMFFYVIGYLIYKNLSFDEYWRFCFAYIYRRTNYEFIPCVE